MLTTHPPTCSIRQAGYYDRSARQSAALIRARRPYLVKNAVTGLGVAGFALGVCSSTTGPECAMWHDMSG